ncbi:MAG: hypothetical protein WC869_08745 [Phycisphaerae bacterium]|jgi:hypothetical protein
MCSETQPDRLPEACDLEQLGLSQDQVLSVEVICRRRINTMFRVCCGGRWFVLKWIDRPEMSTELLAYRLLAQERVPVLTHTAGDRALLLEDLASSCDWRLADEADMTSEETGRGIAAWYRRFHEAGRKLLLQQPAAWQGLQREADRVTPESIHTLQIRLGLEDARVLDWAAGQVDPVVRAIRRLPQTLNYNDFHWSNLAVNRTDCASIIVFDYHLLGQGLPHSDCRNVMGCLQGNARQAFAEAYGPVGPYEPVLDAPIATLHALLMASECPKLPRWAHPLVEAVRDGTFERELHAAIDVAEEVNR